MIKKHRKMAQRLQNEQFLDTFEVLTLTDYKLVKLVER